MTSSVGHADTSIGNCFFFGSQPSSGTTIGGMTVYHNGTLRLTGSRGNQSIYEVSGGEVWVLYSDHSQKEKYVFLGGSVQACDKNIH
ncbi:MAG: hypothetical protein QGG40_12130 [Myxococcota bacterium]|nr:hypothetical protein [Myxococcota bacterium]